MMFLVDRRPVNSTVRRAGRIMRFLIVFAIGFVSSFVVGSHSFVRADVCVADTLKVSHINGRVMALGKNEEPIPNVSIELKQHIDDDWVTKFKTTSDDNGLFSIDNVPTGKYDLYVTNPFYHSFATRVNLKMSKSKPTREIIVTLGVGFHDCGSASVRKLGAGRTSNKSLDRSGGSVFPIKPGAAKVGW